MSGEKLHNFELLFCKLDRLSVLKDTALGIIDYQPPIEFYLYFTLAAFFPAQVGGYPGQQFGAAEGFQNIVVPARSEALHFIGILNFCREEQDGAGDKVPNPPAEGKSIDVWHVDIQQD